MKSLEEDASSLESTCREYENELMEMDARCWDDALEQESQNEASLQADISSYRSRLAKCESEITALETKIVGLNEDVVKANDEQSAFEQQQKEEELKRVQELSDVQKDLKAKLEEFDQV
jgi:chromosome segregation ATPase